MRTDVSTDVSTHWVPITVLVKLDTSSQQTRGRVKVSKPVNGLVVQTCGYKFSFCGPNDLKKFV